MLAAMPRETTFTHDKLNRVASSTMAAGSPQKATSLIDYHPLGMVRKSTDPLDRETLTTFDTLFNPETVTEASNTDKPAQTKFDYDKVGNLLSVTDPRGDFFTTTFGYDKTNRQISVSGPTGSPEDPKPMDVTIDYDPIGNVIRRTDARGNNLEIQMDYNAAGRLERSLDQLGQATTYSYDAIGNVTRMETPSLDGEHAAVLVTTYDKLGFRSSIADTLGNTTCFVNDDHGQVIAMVDPRSGRQSCEGAINDEDYRTRFYYDGVGRRIAAVDAEGNRSETYYDVLGNVALMVDPRTFDAGTPGRFETTYEYDLLGHLMKTTTGVGPQGIDELATEKYTFDKVGNLLRYEDPRGPQFYKENTYDPLDNLTSTTVGLGDEDGGTLITTMEHDVVGNLVWLSDARGAYHTNYYTHDAGNRLLSVSEPTGGEQDPGPLAVTRFTYDQAGNLLSEQDPRGKLLHVHLCH